MNADFWRRKWEANDIGFHREETNPFLVKYFQRLSLAPGARVFLPLCGKTRDIPWLLSKGFPVAGAELSKIAIDQLFAELALEPRISTNGKLEHYTAENIDIFVGDIFDLTGPMLGFVDAIYDRAALVALPEKMRRLYAAHLMKITNHAPQLLICYEYDQALAEGPPFSVSDTEVRELYGHHYRLSRIASVNVAGGLRGKCESRENVWLLKKADDMRK